MAISLNLTGRSFLIDSFILSYSIHETITRLITVIMTLFEELTFSISIEAHPCII